jgi:hypothetical protein
MEETEQKEIQTRQDDRQRENEERNNNIINNLIQYDALPEDVILRPPTPQIPGVLPAPSGWKLRVPPNVFQIYKKFGYTVDVRHIPGQQIIFLDWTLQPPQWEEFIQQQGLFSEEDKNKLNNQEVEQQVYFISPLLSFIHFSLWCL